MWIVKGLAGGAAMMACALSVSNPAMADPAVGTYVGTIVASPDLEEGSTAPFTATSCGPDCFHLVQTGPGWNLQRQGGGIWSQNDPSGIATFDENTLVLNVQSVRGSSAVIQLVKTG